MGTKKRKAHFDENGKKVKKSKLEMKHEKKEDHKSEDEIQPVKDLPCKSSRKDLTEVELTAVREEIKRKQKAAMESPKIFLNLEGDDVLKREGVPYISSKDLQHLLIYTLHKHQASVKAKWCRLLRHNKLHSTLLVLVDSVSAGDFQQHMPQFKFLNNSFPMRVHLINAGEYGMKTEEELFSVPVSHRKQVHGVRKEVEDIGRLDLMMDPFEMIAENYPMPNRDSSSSDYMYSKDTYEKPTESSKMFAIDCEMVETSLSNRELAWVSVVDEDLEVVYESLVLPQGAVTNYLTKYSGISKETLAGVSTRLQDVQRALHLLLPPDAILVGQSLNFDLHALKLFHPFVIDTACLFNLSGYRFKKPKLQLLSGLFLKREIQMGEGHDPREDAEAAMQLVHLKLKKGLAFGDVLQGWKVGEMEGEMEGDQREVQTCSVVLDERFAAGGGGVSTYKGLTVEAAKIHNGLLENGDRKNINGETELKSLFFRSTKYNMNLFRHFIDEGKQVSLVNFPEKLFETESPDGLGLISCDDEDVEEDDRDKLAMRRCRQEIRNGGNFLTAVKFRNTASDCNKCFKRSLRDVDVHMKKLHACLPSKSLMLVVLAGRGSGDCARDGMSFLKVKTDE